MVSNWEEVFETSVPDERLKDGELARMRYRTWRNEVVLFKIRCLCGGETFLLPILCDWLDGTHDIKGICMTCEKRLAAQVHFFHD